MRVFTPLLLLALASPQAWAQTPAPEPSPPAESRLNQRTERIRVEDGGSRIDELRVGGQTQSITVQPKVGTLPEYEVQSSDGVRNRSRSGAESTTGARVWNIKKF